MSTPDIAELLRKGIEAARDNKKAEARGFFEQVVEFDEKNEKGWFWLASVVETDDERRICLGNVLHINPNNERAKRALDALNVKSKEKKTVTNQQEVVAGVSRGQLTLIIGIGAVIVVLLLIVALVVIVGNNNRQATERSTEVAVAQLATDGMSTSLASAAQATGTSTAATATAAAQITIVPPTANIPTLPPTWTLTPTSTSVVTATPLPAPVGLSGRLGVWGGQDLLNTGYLPIGYFDFDNGATLTPIGSETGKHVTFSLDGQRVIYEVYDQLIFSSSLSAINVNGTQIESLPDRWRGQNVIAPQSPRYGGVNRQQVVFVATTDKQNTTQVFLLDLNAPQGQSALKQLTSDAAAYTDPALSPDGNTVVVVRSDLNTANPTVDLVNINVSNNGQIPVTNDGGAYVESTPFFSKDGSQVVYSAAPSNAPKNNDILIKNTDGSGSSRTLYQSPANDIDPILSPDGRNLAYASNPSGEYDIYVVNLNSNSVSQLTNTPTDDFPGDWWQQP